MPKFAAIARPRNAPLRRPFSDSFSLPRRPLHGGLAAKATAAALVSPKASTLTGMSTESSNGLALASSAYLRSAMHQPIRWYEWGAEAFATAQRENKPMLLDIGAVWCHWCHVMDRESYDDPEVAQIVNEHFVAVKVDRDERPDIDSRYQVAVSAISGQGGWPLTGFLTPDGRPFFGGTYFPRDDRHGRPKVGREPGGNGLQRLDASCRRSDNYHRARGLVGHELGVSAEAVRKRRAVPFAR